MKLNVDTVLLNAKGKAFKEQEADDDGKVKLDENDRPVLRDMLLRDVLVAALDRAQKGDEALGHVDRARLGSLAIKIADAENEVEITAKDITTMQERLAKTCFSNVLIARVDTILESIGSEQTEEAKE